MRHLNNKTMNQVIPKNVSNKLISLNASILFLIESVIDWRLTNTVVVGIYLNLKPSFLILIFILLVLSNNYYFRFNKKLSVQI